MKSLIGALLMAAAGVLPAVAQEGKMQARIIDGAELPSFQAMKNELHESRILLKDDDTKSWENPEAFNKAVAENAASRIVSGKYPGVKIDQEKLATILKEIDGGSVVMAADPINYPGCVWDDE